MHLSLSLKKLTLLLNSNTPTFSPRDRRNSIYDALILEHNAEFYRLYLAPKDILCSSNLRIKAYLDGNLVNLVQYIYARNINSKN